MEKRAKRTGDIVHRLEYTVGRNRLVTQLERNLKQDYFIAAFEEAGKDLRKLWRLIRQLLGGKNSKLEIKELSGESDNSKMANIMNDFL